MPTASIKDTGIHFLTIMIRLIDSYFEELNKEVHTVVKKNSKKAIHGSRISSRRIRTLLKLIESLSPSGKILDSTNKIKEIAGKLGALRDLDVQLLYLKNLIKTSTTKRYRQSIKQFIRHLNQKRHGILEKDLKLLKETDKNDKLNVVRNNVIGFLKQEQEFSPLNDVKIFYQLVNDILLKIYNDLKLSYKSLYKPQNIEELHETRIVIKQIRYTLEIFAPFYHHRLDKLMDISIGLQNLLGKIHDCDIWIAQLQNLSLLEKTIILGSGKNHISLEDLNGGLAFLIRHRKRERKSLAEHIKPYRDELNRYLKKEDFIQALTEA
jgi:CHAD domain-containing protein